MKLLDRLGQHVTVHTPDGPITGILLDVSEGTGPQYIVVSISLNDEEQREEVIPWHEVKKIFPYSRVDEEVITQLEHLRRETAEP